MNIDLTVQKLRHPLRHPLRFRLLQDESALPADARGLAWVLIDDERCRLPLTAPTRTACGWPTTGSAVTPVRTKASPTD